MMMSFRRPGFVRRTVSRLMITALVSLSAGPLLHADDCHDAACDVAIVHDHSQHQRSISGASEQRAHPDLHCIACHWVRVVRGPLGWVRLDAPSLPSEGRLLDVSEPYISSSSSLPLPARAPPTHA